jgi:prophage regulatory protein
MQSRPAKIIRLPQVRERTGLSTSTIYSMMAKGLFPKQVQLGAHSVGWVDIEIDDFNAACVARRDANWQSLGDAATRAIKKIASGR